MRIGVRVWPVLTERARVRVTNAYLQSQRVCVYGGNDHMIHTPPCQLRRGLPSGAGTRSLIVMRISNLARLYTGLPDTVRHQGGPEVPVPVWQSAKGSHDMFNECGMRRVV